MSWMLKGKRFYNFLARFFKSFVVLAVIGTMIFLGYDFYRINFAQSDGVFHSTAAQTPQDQSQSKPAQQAAPTQNASSQAPSSQAPYTESSYSSYADPKCVGIPTHGTIPQQPTAQEALPSKEQALAQLAGLTVGEREGWKTYCRDAFGEALTTDFTHTGCTSRQIALKRTAQDLKTIPMKREYGTCDEVLSATWTDPYNGKVTHIDDLKSADSTKIQIDHMVPLFNAWISGADKWTADQRAIFAADVSSQELWAVDADVNTAKGNMAPDEWKPDAAYQCTYAKAFTSVKAKYKLIVVQKEKEALQSMLESCQA